MSSTNSNLQSAADTVNSVNVCDGSGINEVSAFQADWNAVAAETTDPGDGTYDATVVSMGALPSTSGTYDQPTQAAVAYASSSGTAPALCGGGSGGNTSGGGAASDAGVLAALQAIDPNPCLVQSASVGNQSVMNFQTAWNNAGGSPQLTVDGFFGPLSAAAAGAVESANGVSSTLPSGGCTSYTVSGGGGGVTPVTPNVTPQVIPPNTPIVPPPAAPSSTSGLSTTAKIILAVIAAAAVGAIAYVLMKKPGKKHAKHAEHHHAHAPKRRRRKRR